MSRKPAVIANAGRYPSVHVLPLAERTFIKEIHALGSMYRRPWPSGCQKAEKRHLCDAAENQGTGAGIKPLPSRVVMFVPVRRNRDPDFTSAKWPVSAKEVVD